MASYDNKLGEWYKQLEKRAQEVRARKRGSDLPSQEEAPDEEAGNGPAVVELTVPANQAASTSLEAVETSQVVAGIGAIDAHEMTGDPRPAQPVREDIRPPLEPLPSGESPSLFDDAELPPVEDFLSFLNHAPAPEASAVEQLPAIQPREDTLRNLIEGTGEPRPIVRRAEPEKVVEAQPEPAEAVRIPTPPAETPVQSAPAPKPAPVAQQIPDTEEAVAQEKYDRLPQQLQSLFATVDAEVAQNSYKAFRESRASLIQRLLDPTITLEEAARILNVCPTTVRRYTNRGVLPHLRTAGNQRRFRLSDVLAFMDNNAARSSRSGAVQTDTE